MILKCVLLSLQVYSAFSFFVEIRNDPSCPETGAAYYPHYSNCSRFFECLDGVLNLRECPEEYAWDADKQECFEEDEVSCYYTTLAPTSPGPTCPNDGVYYFPHLSDCQQYYECNEGEITLKRCEDGFLWNIDVNVCDYDELVDCSYTTSAPTTTQLPTSAIPVLEECPETGIALIPNLGDCNAFYQCENGTRYPDKCPDDYAWSLIESKCLPEDEVDCSYTTLRPSTPSSTCPSTGTDYLPDYTDCTRYYECNEGEKTSKTCPEGNAWSIEENACLLDEFVDCSYTISTVTTRSSITTEPFTVSSPPTETTEEPTYTTAQPTETSTEPFTPTETTEEPTYTTAQPTEASTEPFTPTETTEEPTYTTAQPTETSTEPFTPTETTEEPTFTTAQPTETSTETPEEPTEITEPTSTTAGTTESSTDTPEEPTITEPTYTTAGPTESSTDTQEEPTITEPTYTTAGPTETSTGTPEEPTETSTESTEKPTETTEEFTSTWSSTEIPIDQCPDKGLTYLPYYADCSYYYQCDDGNRTRMKCKDGYAWNIFLSACDDETVVDCSYTTVLPTTTDEVPVCPSTGTSYYPYPNDCSYFYECANGNLNKIKCPDGYFWDATTNSGCKPADTVDCSCKNA